MTSVRANRIIDRRKELGLSQSDLAELVGISQQAVNQIESGEIRRPRKLREIAIALKCSEDWLLGGRDKPKQPDGVPLISWVQAGGLAEVVDSFELGDAEKWIDYPATHSRMIALRVNGSSMNHISPEGSIIIIDLNKREMSGNRFYVVKIGDEATYKRYRDNPPRLEPSSTEPHEIIFLDKVNALAVGQVVRTMMDID